MYFRLKITFTAKKVLKKLKGNPGNSRDYKAIRKAITFFRGNPRHYGLQTHIIYSIKGLSGEKVFKAYAQQNTPSAYRIFLLWAKRKRNNNFCYYYSPIRK